MTSIVHKDNTN